MDVKARVGSEQAFGSAAQHALAGVDGNVLQSRPLAHQAPEQHPGFARSTATELDELARLRALRNVVDDLFQQTLLGSRQVIFRQVTDLIEQTRTALIVKIFWRQRLRRAGQTSPYIGKERCTPVGSAAAGVN